MTPTKLKVSVAMTTHNGCAFVEHQIESILSQTRPPDEIVVSDDCSADRTLDFVTRATNGCNYPVHIIENARNLGPLKNFERAILKTTGDVIFLSAQDDFWFPEKVSAMVALFADSSDVMLAYSDAELADRELRPTGITLFSLRPRLRLVDELKATQAVARALLVQGPTIAFHRKLMPFLLPFPCPGVCAEDRWISLIAHALGMVRKVDRPLVYYRRHSHNVGGHSDLDGNVLLRTVRGADLELYAYRTRRLDAYHRRLQEIKASDLHLPSSNRLDEFLEATENSLRFARVREKMKSRPRVARLPAGLWSFVRGDYYRHASGAKSFIFDVAIN